MSDPAILSTAQLADLLGLSRSTVHAAMSSDLSLAACIVRRTKRSTWWSVQRLRDRGFLIAAPRPASAPALQFSYVVSAVGGA